MSTKPLCPYCGDELWYDRQLKENYDDDYRNEEWLGYCNRCDKDFTWREKYKRINIDELEEVSDS